jgi:hypothetical protein
MTDSINSKMPSLIDSRLKRRLNPVVSLERLNLPEKIIQGNKNKAEFVNERRRTKAPGPLRLTIDKPFQYGRRQFMRKVDDFLSFLEMESVSFPVQASIESKCDFFRAVDNAKTSLRNLKQTIYRFNDIAAITEKNRCDAHFQTVYKRTKKLIQARLAQAKVSTPNFVPSNPSQRENEAMLTYCDSLRGHPIVSTSDSSQREQEVFNNYPSTSMRRPDISLFPVVTIQESENQLLIVD